MKDESLRLWTIQELCAAVEQGLAVGYEGSPNGQVRDIPNLRTVRYYTTAGLLDRPCDFRGRTALYGQRHLLQLLAIKKLQANGLSLVQVQQRLAGATDATLRQLAGWPHVPEPDLIPTGSPRNESADGQRPFWKSRPAPASAQPASFDQSGEQPPLDAERSRGGHAFEEMASFQAIALADRVFLLLDPARSIDRQELPRYARRLHP